MAEYAFYFNHTTNELSWHDTQSFIIKSSAYNVKAINRPNVLLRPLWIVSQPTKAIVSPLHKSLLQAIYLSRYVLYIAEMSARADNNFLQSWKVFKTETQNGRQIHYEMYYYSIYPEPLSSITLVYLHFQGGNLSKSNPLWLFKAI